MRNRLHSVCSAIRENILAAITICYISGAVSAKYWQLSITTMDRMAWTLLIICLALAAGYRTRHSHLLLLPLFFCIGLVHTGHGLFPPDDPGHIYNLVPERAEATLTGRVLNMPEYNGDATRFDLAADSILIHGKSEKQQQPAHGRVRLTMDGEPPPALTPGNRVMLLASVNRPYSFQTPGVFDYPLYLAEKGIHVSGRIKSPETVIPFQDAKDSWLAGVRFMPERQRQKIAAFLQARLTPDAAAIYQALLIGSRSSIADNVQEQFKATGCMHLLAISGIHMSLLGLMAALALAWIMKRSSRLLLHTHAPTIATLTALLPLTLYAFIAGLNTPVLRSLLMSWLFLIGVVLQRQRSIVFIIAAAALFLLIFKPLALFTVSFQLSFASILAIAVIYPGLLDKFERNGPAPEGKIKTYISTALLVSVAASLGALPFMLLHFNRFSLIGPVMNLLVEPLLCLWALPLGLLAMPLLYIAPGIAALLLKTGSLGIAIAGYLTRAGSALPFASFSTVTPAPVDVLVYYLLLFLWLRHAKTTGKKIALTAGSAFMLLGFTHGLWMTLPSPATKLSFIDVGKGSSTLLEMKNGRTFLIDGGGNASASFNIGERVIAPFLLQKRIWRIDDVIITHPDSDHANGLDFIINRFKPKRLWVNGDDKESWPYDELLQLAGKRGIKIIKPESNQTIEIDRETRIAFLRGADALPRGTTVNDRSLVIRLDHGGNSFLFPGDISKTMEREMVRAGINLQADVLLAPHHGSSGSSSKEFIAEVDPDNIIVSLETDSRKRYLTPQRITEWRNQGRQVFTTADSGTITVESDGINLRIKSFTGGADRIEQ